MWLTVEKFLPGIPMIVDRNFSRIFLTRIGEIIIISPKRVSDGGSVARNLGFHTPPQTRYPGPFWTLADFSKNCYPGGRKSIPQDEPDVQMAPILFSMCCFRLVWPPPTVVSTEVTLDKIWIFDNFWHFLRFWVYPPKWPDPPPLKYGAGISRRQKCTRPPQTAILRRKVQKL